MIFPSATSAVSVSPFFASPESTSRAKQLIAIAHPNFRDELRFEAKKRGMLI